MFILDSFSSFPSAVDEGHTPIRPHQGHYGFTSRLSSIALTSNIVDNTLARNSSDLINSNACSSIEPSVEDFFEMILKILADPSQLRMLSFNCRKYAETLFSIKNAQIIQESYGICRV